MVSFALLLFCIGCAIDLSGVALALVHALPRVYNRAVPRLLKSERIQQLLDKTSDEAVNAEWRAYCLCGVAVALWGVLLVAIGFVNNPALNPAYISTDFPHMQRLGHTAYKLIGLIGVVEGIGWISMGLAKRYRLKKIERNRKEPPKPEITLGLD